MWAEDGTLHRLAKEVFARFGPPPADPPPPSQFAWGIRARMRELLEPDFELQFENGCTMLRAPDGVAIWELWKESHGLTVTRLAALDADTRKAFRDAFIEFHERHRTGLGIAMPRDYVIAVGTRR